MKNAHVLITAAGSSHRMGEIDKLTLHLRGMPLIAQTLSEFLQLPSLSSLTVTVNPERVEEFVTLFEQNLAHAPVKISITAGGTSRQKSILNGLRFLNERGLALAEDCVLIHDGARPFVGQDLLSRLLLGLETCDGVIPALPVRDTIKRVKNHSVIETENRETLRLVQTPQVFRFKNILDLHERAEAEGYTGTDDASLLEHYGQSVAWVDGSVYNLKVTVPEDIKLMTYLSNSLNVEGSPVG